MLTVDRNFTMLDNSMESISESFGEENIYLLLNVDMVTLNDVVGLCVL